MSLWYVAFSTADDIAVRCPVVCWSTVSPGAQFWCVVFCFALSLISLQHTVVSRVGRGCKRPLKPCAPTLIPLLFCGTRFSFSFATVAESSARSLFARCRLPRMQSEARGVTALHTEMPCESVLTEVHSAQRSLVFDDVEVFALVTTQDLSYARPSTMWNFVALGDTRARKVTRSSRCDDR